MAVAIEEHTSVPWKNLQPLWHRSAPARLKQSCPADDPFRGWKVWRHHLAHRQQPILPPFLSKKQPAILWGWPDLWHRNDLQSVLRSPDILAHHVLEETRTRPLELPSVLKTLALAYSLPALAKEVSPEIWWHCCQRLHEIALHAQHHRIEWHAKPCEIIRQQLLAGEMPLVLGYLLPEVRAMRALRKTARATLSEALVELTDGQGLPHARWLPVLGPLFACWTRCRWLGERLKRGCWSPEADLQYQWLVRHALRLAEANQRFVLTDNLSPGWTKPLFATALELAGDQADLAAAAVAISPRLVPRRVRYTPSNLPKPSLNSDWSGIAVLANGWSPQDIRLALSYASHPLQIELSADGDRLLAGQWQCETTCDGQPVQVVGEWERLCWESSKRCDYLELSVALSHGLRLERQVLLAHRDRVLYLADIIVSADRTPRTIGHTFGLPLDAHARWQPEAETRDGVIIGTKARAAVLPLALGEWRSDPRGGDLGEHCSCLTLTQEAYGRALCCPLCIDLDRKRSRHERTWRQLTVGESLQVVPHDAAVAFRAQSATDQWLFYRSLGPVGNRTFLGQNIAGEFSAGRFLNTGKYKEWIEVEMA
jgi:hypothetical protein